MKKIKFSEAKYRKAIEEFVKQTVAMAQEDCTEDGVLDEDSVYELALQYMGDAQVDINAKLDELMDS